MGAFDFLPTMAEVNAQPHAKQKGQIPTRLQEKTADDRDEKRDEKAWRKACIKRDGKICRKCKRVVVPQLELAPNRLEVHHVTGRADQAVRWDVRNGLILCAEDHGKVTRHELHIHGTGRDMFEVNGKQYLNGSSKRLKFVEPK